MAMAFTKNILFEGSQFDLDHELHEILRRFQEINSFRDLCKKPEFRAHQAEIERLTKGVAYHLSSQVKRRLKHALRVVHWNVERGRNLDSLISHLKSDPYLFYADVMILTETDIGMARSGNRHVAKEIGRELGFQYLYVNSYLCISKGTIEEQKANGENQLGLSGLTLLTRLPIRSWKAIPLPRWLDLIRGPEKCIGKKKSLLAILDFNETQKIAIAGVHLEAHSSPSHRKRQMKAILNEIEEFVPKDCPVLFLGIHC